MNKERTAGSLPGIPMLLVLIVATLATWPSVILYYIGDVLVPGRRQRRPGRSHSSACCS